MQKVHKTLAELVEALVLCTGSCHIILKKGV